MSVCENLEQIEQIDSELENVSQVDSEISNIAQINSELGNVIAVRTATYMSDLIDDTVYKGSFIENDWQISGSKFYITIVQSTHLLANPFVQMFEVTDIDGYTNAFYSYKTLPNNSILFESDLRINGRYIIKGEK